MTASGDTRLKSVRLALAARLAVVTAARVAGQLPGDALRASSEQQRRLLYTLRGKYYTAVQRIRKAGGSAPTRLMFNCLPPRPPGVRLEYTEGRTFVCRQTRWCPWCHARQAASLWLQFATGDEIGVAGLQLVVGTPDQLAGARREASDIGRRLTEACGGSSHVRFVAPRRLPTGNWALEIVVIGSPPPATGMTDVGAALQVFRPADAVLAYAGALAYPAGILRCRDGHELSAALHACRRLRTFYSLQPDSCTDRIEAFRRQMAVIGAAGIRLEQTEVNHMQEIAL